MDKIFEAIINLIPFAETFEKAGISEETSLALAGLIIVVFGCVCKKLLEYLINRYKNTKIAKDLAPYFDYLKVKTSRDLFIPTQFQNQSPTREDEPKFSHKFVSKSPLIPHFIKTAFNEKKESDKFYLVLADSGMGKTTFMINLYVHYTSFFNFRKKYKIRLFPFGDTRILDKIKEIKQEACNTILLLDAFDEDKELLSPAEPDGLSEDKRFRRRLDQIIDAVQDFREVVITSRTQFFPGQDHEPYELKIRRYDDRGFHTLAKLYLSPFDDKEIKRYLRKKYGIIRLWNLKKKRIATAIVKSSPKLMVRPMLLGYIDYLVGENRVFQSTWEIYETLVDKWIEREALKRKHKTVDRKKFKQDLHTYSRLVALEIYRQRKQTNLLSLHKDASLEIAHKNNIELKNYEITGQSLLTRDVEGNWKFAHKSILEFFIALEAFEEAGFPVKTDFAGMEMVKQFLLERYPHKTFPWNFVFIKGGTFLMGSPANEVDRRSNETRHQVKVSDFYMSKYTVTVEQFEAFIKESNYRTSSRMWSCDVNRKVQKDKQHPVIWVSWNDATEYCKWLSNKLNAVFRLPTEAEWEYACRAGTTTPFNTGENLTTGQANYNGSYPYNKNPKGEYLRKTTPVGKYPPNVWGLFDMHGNVWEWCMDKYGEKYYDECRKLGIVENPVGPGTGSGRVLRGGSWYYDARSCRSACRNFSNPVDRCDYTGFRLAFVP